MPRYSVSDARGWSRVVQWRIRARVEDEQTGDSIEFSRRSMAEEVAELLDRATRGERPVEPSDATPFPAYDISHGEDGWIYVGYGDGRSAIRQSLGLTARIWHDERRSFYLAPMPVPAVPGAGRSRATSDSPRRQGNSLGERSAMTPERLG